MTIKKSIGGNRLGSGNRMKVSMHGYGRSNHNLSRIWRSTMAPGTLVPCFVEPCLTGDTWDIDVHSLIRTLPTVGPLFGRFKIQVDFFEADDRLYNRMLHNNLSKVGLDMSKVLLPTIQIQGKNCPTSPNSQYNGDPNQWNIAPDSLFAYLGIRGIGTSSATDPTGKKDIYRQFQCIPWLAYWEIYKNYYANQQEEVGYVITGEQINQTKASINTAWYFGNGAPQPGRFNLLTEGNYTVNLTPGDTINIFGDGLGTNNILLQTDPNTKKTIEEYVQEQRFTVVENSETKVIIRVSTTNPLKTIYQTDPDKPGISTNDAIAPSDPAKAKIKLQEFPLSIIDSMRNKIFEQPNKTPLVIHRTTSIEGGTAEIEQPYLANLGIIKNDGRCASVFPMAGLGIKTYNSDRFNNWIKIDWIDGPNGVAAISSVPIVEGKFTIDSLNLMQKIYNLMNRVAISGGTYQDWLETTTGMNLTYNPEIPVFKGGFHGTIEFNEVVSTAETESMDESNPDKSPLGSLAGRGYQANESAGKVIIKAKEHGYIIGIVSITPEIDYSQGNHWYTSITNMDQWHKPELSQIGYQELITEEMAAWDTIVNNDNGKIQVTTKSAGKQTAWIEYQTAVNQTYGNFARPEQMYMTLNRRYEANPARIYTIGDLTTYIDPTKYNYAFAESDLNAQNFWVQIAMNVTARRIMSAKAIPNL